MVKILIRFITVLSYISAIPAIWIGRRIRGLLWYYACASFLCDFCSLIATRCFGYQTRIFGNVFTLLELTLIGFYFSSVLNGWLRKLSVVAIIGLAIWYTVKVWSRLNEKDWQFNAVTFMFLILACLIALYQVIRNIEHLKIEHSPLFIFSAPFLLYASYSLVLMLFADNFKSASLDLRHQVWCIHDLLNALKNLAIARVLSLQQKAIDR